MFCSYKIVSAYNNMIIYIVEACAMGIYQTIHTLELAAENSAGRSEPLERAAVWTVWEIWDRSLFEIKRRTGILYVCAEGRDDQFACRCELRLY